LSPTGPPLGPKTFLGRPPPIVFVPPRLPMVGEAPFRNLWRSAPLRLDAAPDEDPSLNVKRIAVPNVLLAAGQQLQRRNFTMSTPPEAARDRSESSSSQPSYLTNPLAEGATSFPAELIPSVPVGEEKWQVDETPSPNSIRPPINWNPRDPHHTHSRAPAVPGSFLGRIAQRSSAFNLPAILAPSRSGGTHDAVFEGNKIGRKLVY